MSGGAPGREATGRDRLEAAAFRAASSLACAFPRSFSLGAARALGRGLSLLLGSRRRIALDNVEAVFGDALTPSQRRGLVRRSFGHSAAMAVDLLTLPRVAREVDGLGEADEQSRIALAEALGLGHGAILVAGHFGLMESMGILLGRLVADLGTRLSFVSKPFDNPLLEAAVQERRGATGNGTIHKGGAKPRLVECLSRGELVAIVLDQHVGPHDRIWVPFLDLPAATSRSVGTLSLQTGAPLVPIHSFPLPRGRFRCEFGPVLRPRRTGDDATDARELVARAVAELDRATRRLPEAWNWIHRRWKVRPDDAPERYPGYSRTESEERARTRARRAAVS